MENGGKKREGGTGMRGSLWSKRVSERTRKVSVGEENGNEGKDGGAASLGAYL